MPAVWPFVTCIGGSCEYVEGGIMRDGTEKIAKGKKERERERENQ